MELVVVSTLLSSFDSICLSYWLCWAWLLQVGRALAPIVVAQFLYGPLERVILRSSVVYTLPVFSLSAKLLQVCFLRSSRSRSSGLIGARASSSFSEKFLEMKIYA